jgi:hypothetical protein
MNDRNSPRRVGVFISHNSADKVFARRLASDLSAAGARVWIDEAEIKVGDSLIERIRKGIDTMDYIAVVLTPTSVSSEWVRKELDIAMNREIEEKRVTVLPLLVHDCELPSFLKGKKYADFRQEHRYRAGLADLCAAIGITLSASEPSTVISPQHGDLLQGESVPTPTKCPECKGDLRTVSIETMYSGDGGYIAEDGFECWECRRDFVLQSGELLRVEPKGSVYPPWFNLLGEIERRKKAKHHDGEKIA